MNEDLADIQFSPIRDFKYEQWFKEVQYNGNTLSDTERKEVISVIDDSIAKYSEGFPLYQAILDDCDGKHDVFHETERTVASVMLFVLITMIDSMVASKYFLLADGDYDRRFLRGKLMVILNEGFKRLYGFDKLTYKKSEWGRLLPIMGHFPEEINRQYQELSFLLEKHAHSSSWWREERNLETHIVAEKLYYSRQEEIIESKVMMDSLMLFDTLFAVSHFLANVHACLLNYLVAKYKNGELKE